MKSILIVLLFIASTQGIEWTKVRPLMPRSIWNSKLAHNFGRIVGGNEATPGQFPYQVAVIVDGIGLCGGFLISETIVLLIGHCLDGSENVQLIFGAHNLYDPNEAGRVTMMTTDKMIHEDYDIFTVQNDIGFVRLVEPVSLSSSIEIIRLPSRSQETETFTGNSGVVSGWGTFNSSNPGLSPVLKFAEFEVITNEECALSFPVNFVVDSMICANPVTGNTCYNDAGSPLVVKEADGINTAVGITAFGTPNPCEASDPSGFTRISSFLDWIEKNSGVNIRP